MLLARIKPRYYGAKQGGIVKAMIRFLRRMREPVLYYPLTMCPQARLHVRLPRWRAAVARASDVTWAPSVAVCLVAVIFIWVWVLF
jgi:hypothetical protein